MTYFFKVNNDSWGRIIRFSEQVSYNLEEESTTDELTVSFYGSANFENIMDACREIVGEVDTYTLTIEDEEENVIFTSDDYIRLIQSEISLEENDNDTHCIITWSRI